MLVGFSMGGGEVARYIGALRRGARRPGGAGRLGDPFLLKTPDNPGGVDKSVFDQMLAGVRKDRVNFLADFSPNFFKGGLLAPKASDDVIAYNKALAWPASPLATQQCVVAFGETDFRADLAKFTVPTLVMHGDHDGIVPLDASGRPAAERIAGARLEVIGGAPHGFNVTHAERFNELLLDFLKGA